MIVAALLGLAAGLLLGNILSYRMERGLWPFGSDY